MPSSAFEYGLPLGVGGCFEPALLDRSCNSKVEAGTSLQKKGRCVIFPSFSPLYLDFALDLFCVSVVAHIPSRLLDCVVTTA